jgi:hypothetical protein
MLNKIFRFIIGVLGGLLGAGLTSLVYYPVQGFLTYPVEDGRFY